MDKFMDAAIEEAELGLKAHGIPIGSVLVHKGAIIGRGHNQRVQKNSVVLTPKWTRLKMPADCLQSCIVRASCTRLCRHARCAAAQLFFTKCQQ